MIEKIAFSATSKLTPFTALRPPKLMLKFSTLKLVIFL
jgi:hypothetical protein